MPQVQVLKITNVRNIGDARLELDPRLNVFCGDNGSGKTSILEALYLLGTGKSFRAHKLDKLIQLGSTQAIVFGVVGLESGGRLDLAVRKDKNRATEIHIGGKTGASQGQLARELPVLAITPESHALIEEGPEIRRRYLDWGVFHVEPRYNEHWQRYYRAMKQRNALLKAGPGKTFYEVEPAWRSAMATEGEMLHEIRVQYLDRLIPLVLELARELVIAFDNVDLRLTKGWSDELGLTEALDQGLDRDLKYLSSQVGPHRADLVLHDDEGLMQSRVSRGQQKLLVYALRLAQIKLLIQTRGVYPVVLLDDLPAELDDRNLRRVLDLLEGFGCQVLVTAIQPSAWVTERLKHGKLFHVEQGGVSLMSA